MELELELLELTLLPVWLADANIFLAVLEEDILDVTLCAYFKYQFIRTQ